MFRHWEPRTTISWWKKVEKCEIFLKDWFEELLFKETHGDFFYRYIQRLEWTRSVLLTTEFKCWWCWGSSTANVQAYRRIAFKSREYLIAIAEKLCMTALRENIQMIAFSIQEFVLKKSAFVVHDIVKHSQSSKVIKQ